MISKVWVASFATAGDVDAEMDDPSWDLADHAEPSVWKVTALPPDVLQIEKWRKEIEEYLREGEEDFPDLKYRWEYRSSLDPRTGLTTTYHTVFVEAGTDSVPWPGPDQPHAILVIAELTTEPL